MRPLLPHLVPEPLWGLSARKLLPRRAWDGLRAVVLAQARGTCSVCGSARERGMVCNEVWHYDEAAGVAALASLGIHCPPCDSVYHLGMSGVIGRGSAALLHMAEVNGIGADAARAAAAAAQEEWLRRSLLRWEVQVAPDLLAVHPELSVLAGLGGSPGDGRRRVRERGGRQ